MKVNKKKEHNLLRTTKRGEREKKEKNTSHEETDSCTPRAPEDPERIYWTQGPPRLRGKCLYVPAAANYLADAFRPLLII